MVLHANGKASSAPSNRRPRTIKRSTSRPSATSEKAPYFRVFAGAIEFGAG